MIRWEYAAAYTSGRNVIVRYYAAQGARVEPRYGAGTEELECIIAEMGSDGWELIQVNGSLYHFKRQL